MQAKQRDIKWEKLTTTNKALSEMLGFKLNQFSMMSRKIIGESNFFG